MIKGNANERFVAVVSEFEKKFTLRATAGVDDSANRLVQSFVSLVIKPTTKYNGMS